MYTRSIMKSTGQKTYLCKKLHKVPVPQLKIKNARLVGLKYIHTSITYVHVPKKINESQIRTKEETRLTKNKRDAASNISL